jgi:hypothetical protein
MIETTLASSYPEIRNSYPRLNARAGGWLKHLHHKATTPDDWSEDGEPHPWWDKISTAPMFNFSLIRAARLKATPEAPAELASNSSQSQPSAHAARLAEAGPWRCSPIQNRMRNHKSLMLTRIRYGQTAPAVWLGTPA